MQSLRLTPMLCAALVLGACGSGTSNDGSAGDGSAPAPVFSDESGSGNDADLQTDSGSTTGQDADSGSEVDGDSDGTGDGVDVGTDGSDGTGDGVDVGTDGSDGTGDGVDVGTDGGDGTGDGTGDGVDVGTDDSDGTGDGVDVGTNSGPDGNEIGAAPDSEPDIILPGIPGNLAATRLILGMERVLKATLLDLNVRYASGSALSEQQQTCLGSYDPALGEPAFVIGCERALATGDVEVYVEQGALYRTADCAADLAAGTADRCVMESARVVMRTRFAVPPEQAGQGRPRPVPGSGVVVGYAVAAPLLTLENDEQSPLQVFDCAFELQNGALLPSIGGREVCDAQVRDAADLIDFLAPVVL